MERKKAKKINRKKNQMSDLRELNCAWLQTEEGEKSLQYSCSALGLAKFGW